MKNAIECIYRDLEYARSLIKTGTQRSSTLGKADTQVTAASEDFALMSPSDDSSWDCMSRGSLAEDSEGSNASASNPRNSQDQRSDPDLLASPSLSDEDWDVPGYAYESRARRAISALVSPVKRA